MKITLFLPSLGGGGAERVFVSLANGFAESGMDVDLVLAKAAGPYLKEVSPLVRVVDLGASRVLTSLPKLISYVRKERPQVVFSTLTEANIISLWAKILTRSKSKFFVREASTLVVSSRHAPTIRGKIMPFLARFFYRFADGIILPSQGARRDFEKALPSYAFKTHTIYNPVLMAHFVSLAQVPFLGKNEDLRVPMILAVGRLTRAKDYETLLRAFSLVCQKRKSRLVILGEGEERSKLQELAGTLNIEKNLVLPGFVENPFVYMKHAALYVLSSRWEGLPNALIQATCLETPVVSTRCPNGPEEILENGRWGALVPVGNVRALAEAMLRALEHPRPSSDTVSRSRFELEGIVQQYETLFEP